MSVLNKIKEITEDIRNLGTEELQVTIVSDSVVIVENYKSIKFFTDEKLLLETKDFFIYICGVTLAVKFFSPSRIILEGNIKSISYLEDSMCISEEL